MLSQRCVRVNQRYLARLNTFAIIALQKRSILSSAIQTRLDEMTNRHNQVMELLNSSGGAAGQQSSQSLGKEISTLSHLVSLSQEKNNAEHELESVQGLLHEAKETKDTELEYECNKELELLQIKMQHIETKIIDAVIPQDDDDYSADAIIEVRAGTGGLEASLFASELKDAYVKTGRALNWNVEVLSMTDTDIGGIREAVLSVTGSASFRLEDGKDLLGPYGVFKFESGVHRVQRVPINDSKIHTSACSVAVLPAAPENMDSGQLLPMSELKIETMRASGAGGQHINTTDSAVRITHIATGIQASIQDERSQHQNKTKALRLIAARVRDRRRSEEEQARGDAKSNLLGGGDRSERIRTYNYSQDRVTDHRSKTTTHGITKLLNGSSEDGLVVTFLPSLKELRRDELLRQLDDTAK
jgi:peptide chain release factor 1